MRRIYSYALFLACFCASAAWSQDEYVEPLDSWVELPKTNQPSHADEPVDVEHSEIPEQSVKSQPEEVVHVGQPTILTLKQRRRFEALLKRVRGRVMEEQKQLAERQWADPRGVPELRVCSLQLGGYGEKSEAKRMIRGLTLTDLRSREQSAISAIISAKCSVVAFQGLVGRSAAYARKGAEIFTEKLKKRTGAPWGAYVSESRHQTVFNGFFVREGLVQSGSPSRTEGKDGENSKETAVARDVSIAEKSSIGGVAGNKTFSEITPPPLGDLKERRITSDVEQLNLRLPAANGPKNVVILSVSLRKALFGVPDREITRVQYAEAIRVLLAKIVSESDPLDPPIFVLAIDRGVERRSATHFVISGRLQLKDFTENCHIEQLSSEVKKKETSAAESIPKLVCNSPIERPQALFDVITEGITQKTTYKRTKKENETRFSLIKPTAAEKASESERRRSRSGLYLLPEDLKFVRERVSEPLHFSSGFVPVKNGQTDSPLVWTDINW